ncbi:hypothetical protein VA7868_03858 [Vibrio aerogenes CECT 7868]|uniref:DUF2989 domain-containing protein n=1 Tax=Vibrio aerogenes CECT 7868 TaxID=1216006 RepID=A0A1M6BSG4_9VIBR|nr:DUF2989 domain-containing protein [Vibrio aerogenes]SHI51651.1 hypothetical protein VA7868_03858 [Vibrio aerogenes CECT 7868]
MYKQFLKYLTIAGIPIIISGCLENRNDTDQLCKDNPGLRCEELNMHDGQCRLTRTNLVWHRRDVLRDPTDINKIEEYKLTQEYKKCLETAAQIQPINQAEIKNKRAMAYVNAGKSMEALEKELLKYNTAESLYFLWSQTGNKHARRQFLRMEGTPELDTARMQYALATFYIDKDREKTLKLLNRALQLSEPKTLNISILESLASLNRLLKHNEESYIWAIVGKEFGVPVASERDLKIIYGFPDEKFSQLDDIADQVTSAIKKKQYKPSLIAEAMNPPKPAEE